MTIYQSVACYNRTNQKIPPRCLDIRGRDQHGGADMNILSQRSGIYEIRNTINGHQYIGGSVNLGTRLQVHRRDLRKGVHVNNHLQRAWNAYGENTFVFNILMFCGKDEVLHNEQVYLDKLRPKYNIAKNTSAPMLGLKMPQGVRDKISAALKGRKRTEEHQRKLNASATGSKRSDEARKNMSLSHLGKSQSEELIQKRVASRKGYKHSEETKQKIGASNKGKKKTYSEETRQRLSDTRRGRVPWNKGKKKNDSS